MPTPSDLLTRQNPFWEKTIPGLTEIHHATWAPHHMVEERGGERDRERRPGGPETGTARREIKREQKRGRSEGRWEEIKERRYETEEGLEREVQRAGV